MMYKLVCQDMNESYCSIDFSGIEDIYKQSDIKVLIADMLSAYVEGYRFTPSYRAGLWDGKERLYKLDENMMYFPKGMWRYLQRKIDTLPDKSVQFEYISSTVYDQVSRETFMEFVKTLEMPFEPYDYQIDASLESINSGRMTIGAATGAGKSCIIYLIMSWFRHCDMRSVLIVPNVSLVEQMYSDFKDYGIKNIEDVHRISAGREKHFNHIMTISTWQSLYNSPALFEDVDAILVDEVHGAKSNVFAEIIMPAAINCKYRIGLTGTMPPGYVDKLKILGALGPHKKFINAQGLIERGLATPVEIKMMYFNYSEADKEFAKKLKKYPDEIDWLNSHRGRNSTIAKYVNQISKSGNTLVMFTKNDHGKTLLEEFLKVKFGVSNIVFLEKITPKRLAEIPDGVQRVFVNTITDKDLKTIAKAGFSTEQFVSLSQYHVYLIYGKVDSDVREEVRQLLEHLEDAVVFASFGTTSTGVSIKRIHNIVLASTTKSGIRLNQTIGRGMRLHTEKEKMKLWDISDDLSRKNKQGEVIESSKNHSLKHSEERLSMHLDNGYPIVEVEVQIPSDN